MLLYHSPSRFVQHFRISFELFLCFYLFLLSEGLLYRKAFSDNIKFTFLLSQLRHIKQKHEKQLQEERLYVPLPGGLRHVLRSQSSCKSSHHENKD